MILQANLNHFNALAIGQYTQTLNNRLLDRDSTIKAIQKVKSFFLVSNEDFIDINSQSNSYFFVTNLIFRHIRQDFSVVTMRACMPFKIHFMGLNLKSRFLESIKRENKEFKGIIKKEPEARIKQIPPISGIKLKDYFLSNLASFSRQVAITQAEKLVFSFLDCSSICSIKSWGKRISLRFDLLVSLAILIIQISLVWAIYTKIKNKNSVDMCGQNKIYCADTLIFKILIKSIAQRVRTSIGYLTQPLTEVMIMANRYDSAPLRAEQSKLFKFYDLSTTKVLETVANTECEARKNLGKQSLIFIARIRLYPIVERSRNWGGYSHE